MAIPVDRYDIVICGGGFAGLTLALQLRSRLPDKSVLILEKIAGPLPAGTHKVGESTNEGGTYLLRQLSGLKHYVESTHIKKLGLRFFGAGYRNEGFDKRFEIGDAVFARNSSYQFDRGVLENDLRRFCRDAGVHIEEGVSVEDIDFGPETHAVTFAYPKNKETSTRERATVTCRWLVDAMGRRRLLQSKLGLAKASGHNASASWWRIQGDFDVAGMVPQEKSDWHERVLPRRWYSTNHLLGPGYWVWVIPLCSNMTSVGIVADEAVHPVRERNSIEKSLSWLAEHERDLFDLIENEKPLDFLVLKNFAYTTTRAFSTERWFCVGEAAAFTDPLYSMGSDLIAIADRITVRSIELDTSNCLTEETVELYNRIYLTVVEAMTTLFRDMYPAFGTDDIMILKVMWDVACYWAFFSQLSIQDVLYQDQLLPQLLKLAERLRTANALVQGSFRDAAVASREKPIKTGFYNFGIVSKVTDLRATVTDRRGIHELTENMDFLERFGSALRSFVLADRCETPSLNQCDHAPAELQSLMENLTSYLNPTRRVSFLKPQAALHEA